VGKARGSWRPEASVIHFRGLHLHRNCINLRPALQQEVTQRLCKKLELGGRRGIRSEDDKLSALQVGWTKVLSQFGGEELIAMLGQGADFARFRDKRLHVAVGREDVVNPRQWHDAAQGKKVTRCRLS
jgi:hypothetical protein